MMSNRQILYQWIAVGTKSESVPLHSSEKKVTDGIDVHSRKSSSGMNVSKFVVTRFIGFYLTGFYLAQRSAKTG